MKIHVSLLAAGLLLALVAAAGAAPAGGAGTRAVEAANATVRDLLRKEAAPGSPAEKKLAAQVTRSVRDFLDIDTLGKQAMRDHWEGLSSGQRREFLQLLRGLVEANYVKALRANLDYEVRYLGEESAPGDQLLVKTEIRVQRRGRPRAIAIDYLLTRDGERWRAADVVTDGVGLVENYRAQFNKIIARDGVAGLLDRMRKKRASM
ncbi:MAG TPA: ABC transporter substrate-binding protein [Kofleriaceae bacterium]|nr:ABC transporter substrate-binding protein [Kofleriaceae bacterium]